MNTNCDWCGDDPEFVAPAVIRVTITDLNGVLLDTVNLCVECARRGVTWDGRAISEVPT